VFGGAGPRQHNVVGQHVLRGCTAPRPRSIAQLGSRVLACHLIGAPVGAVRAHSRIACRCPATGSHQNGCGRGKVSLTVMSLDSAAQHADLDPKSLDCLGPVTWGNNRSVAEGAVTPQPSRAACWFVHEPMAAAGRRSNGHAQRPERCRLGDIERASRSALERPLTLPSMAQPTPTEPIPLGQVVLDRVYDAAPPAVWDRSASPRPSGLSHRRSSSTVPPLQPRST